MSTGPDFLIVGAPKSGTTAMDNFLKQHPEIHIAGRKDMNFFGSDFKPPYPYFFERNKEKYIAEFNCAEAKKCAGESSVWYLYSKRAAAEIKEFNHDAKIVAILRNPVEAIHSLHGQRLLVGIETIKDFRKALAAEVFRKQGRKIAPGTPFPESLLYREVYSYTEQIKRFIAVFGRERMHIIIYDDFKSDPADVYCKLCEFLGVNANFLPVFSIVNPAVKVRVQRLNRLLNVPSVRMKSVIKALLPMFARQIVHNSLRDLNQTKDKRKPLPFDLRLELQKEFSCEIKQLSELLSRDLTHWTKPEHDLK